MTVTAAQIEKIRRMVNEPLTVPYTIALLTTYIETYPIPDGLGYFPSDGSSWTPTYDLNAAAADIWDEKAGIEATKFDFNADGGSYTRSQVYQQMMSRARYYRSRRAPTTATMRKHPREADSTDYPWIGNLPETP